MEFALVAPVFLTMLLGTMELARYYFLAEALRTLSAETARAAFVDSTVTGCHLSAGSVWTKVNKRTPFLDASHVDVCISSGTDSAGHQTLTATASYQFRTFLPLLSRLTATQMIETTRLTH